MARKARKLDRTSACKVLEAAMSRYLAVKQDALARADAARGRDEMKDALADYWQAQDVLLATAANVTIARAAR
ncbi:MAG: hypothetical protein IMZ65_00205 [Planctomycetes bacterium]|nr:hypothetical protein [Planctomycetota bacterium]